MFIRSKTYRTNELSDIEVIEELQSNNQIVAESFYLSCRRYYLGVRDGVFEFKHNGAQEAINVFHNYFLSV